MLSSSNIDIDSMDSIDDINKVLNNNEVENQLLRMKKERQQLIALVNKECQDLFDSRPAVVKKLDRNEWEDSQHKRLARMTANELSNELQASNNALDGVDQEISDIQDRVEKLRAEIYTDVSGTGYTYTEQEQKLKDMKEKELFKLAKKQGKQIGSKDNLNKGSFWDRVKSTDEENCVNDDTCDDKTISKHASTNSAFHISDVYDDSTLKDTGQARQRLPHPIKAEEANVDFA